jgi:hypothetical protein
MRRYRRSGLALFTNVDKAIVAIIARRSGAAILDLHRLTLEGDREAPGIARLSAQAFAER